MSTHAKLPFSRILLFGSNTLNAPLINLTGDLLKFSSTRPCWTHGSIKILIIHKFTVFSEALLHGGALSRDLAVKWQCIKCI